MSHPVITYRPELDGLRAIAIIAVMIYHAEIDMAGIRLLPGGYLGVDLFFVLSGFLITSIIVSDLAKQRFTLIGFYERRARRILPALLVLLLALVPLAWLVTSPTAFSEFSQSLIYTTGFVANIFFWGQDSYSAEISTLKPLIHTWSLAVEEQFYLFFPALLLLLWHYAKRRLHLIVLSLFTVSLLWANYSSQYYPDAAFYSLPARLWELLAGALLAIQGTNLGYKEPTFKRQISTWLGLSAITYALLFFDDSHALPSFITLLPVLGMVLVIATIRPGDVLHRLLSARVLVMIGLMSYSLYLWHQPVLAFTRIVAIDALSQATRWWFLMACFPLAYVSWRFIETPFRDAQLVSTRVLWLSLSVGIIFVLTVGGYGVVSKGAPQRLHGMAQVASAAANKPWLALSQNGRTCYDRAVADACYFSASKPESQSSIHAASTAELTSLAGLTIPDAPAASADSTIAATLMSPMPLLGAHKAWVLAGDSHLSALAVPLMQRLRAQSATLIPLTMGGCFYAPSLQVIKDGKTHKCSYAVNNERQQLLLKMAPATVIIGGRLPLYLSGQGFDNEEGGREKINVEIYGENLAASDLARYSEVKHAIGQAVRKLLNHGHTVVLLYPIPEVGWNVPERLPKLLAQHPYNRDGWLLYHGITTSYAVFRQRSRTTYAIYDAIGSHARLIRVYPEKIFCNTSQVGRCITHDQHTIFYADDDHLSFAGSHLLIDLIFTQLQRADADHKNTLQ